MREMEQLQKSGEEQGQFQIFIIVRVCHCNLMSWHRSLVRSTFDWKNSSWITEKVLLGFCTFFHGVRNVGETGLDRSIWRGNVEILTPSGHHVFVCSGCHIKIPQTGWLKWQTLISHSSESWKSIINVPANSVSVKTFFLACLWPPAYCTLTAPFLCGMGREKDWEKESEMVCLPLLIKAVMLGWGSLPHDLI